MGHPLLRSLRLLVLLGPALAPAQARGQEGKPPLPNQFFGATVRIGGAGIFGTGAGNGTSPLWAVGGALSLRLAESVYLDLSGDSTAPVASSPAQGSVLLQIEQQELGIKTRLGPPAGHGVLGLGGGYARLHDISGMAKGAGGVAYLQGGYEALVFGGGENAGLVGGELVFHQYFMPSDATFGGSLVEGRLTFSYYFGGSEVSECW